jgi:hypothetical protein
MAHSSWEHVKVKPALKWERVNKPKPKEEDSSADWRKALETLGSGLTFGALPTAEGVINIPFGRGNSIKERFLGGKRLAERNIREFKEENPKTATTLDIVGSVVPALFTGGSTGYVRGAGFAAKALRAAKTGAIFGAASGAGHQLNKVTEPGKISDKIVDSLKNIGTSAAGGAAGGAALSGVGHLFHKVPYKKIMRFVPKEDINKAIEKKVPLVNFSDDAVTTGKGLSNMSAQARQIINAHKNKTQKEQYDKIKEIIEQYIEPANNKNRLEEIIKAKEAIFKPNYEAMEQVGEVPLTLTGKNPAIPMYRRIARNQYAGDLANVPEGHAQEVDKMLMVLEDRIKSKQRAGKLNEARSLIKLKEDLQTDLENKAITRADARKAYGDYKRIEKDIRTGEREFGKMEDYDIDKLVQEVQDGKIDKDNLKTGIARYFQNLNFNTPRTSNNSFSKVFSEDDLRRIKKMEFILNSQKEKNKFTEFANTIGKHEKAVLNSKTLGGEQQPLPEVLDLQNQNPLRWVFTPKRRLMGESDTIWRRLTGDKSSKEMAELLTNPEKLEGANKLHELLNPKASGEAKTKTAKLIEFLKQNYSNPKSNNADISAALKKDKKFNIIMKLLGMQSGRD